MSQEFHDTASNAGLIGLTAFAGALVGFVLQLLVAYHFGASSNTDAYFMAISTSEMLSKLLLGGSITAVFLPIFVERLTRGERSDAWDLALNIFHLTSAVFIAAVVLLAIFAGPFVRFIAPGFDVATSELTVSLLRVLLPSFLFLFLTELATSMMHSLKQFGLPAAVRVIAPTVSIIAIVLFVKSIGIFALAVGAVLGSVIQFSFLLYGLNRQGLKYRLVFQPRDPTIRKLLILVYPFIFSVLMTQAAGITYRILVSDLAAGSLAALKFAEKITQLVTIIFLNSVTLVIYPLLSAKAAARDLPGMQDTIASAIRLITLATIPIIIGVILLRDPLISLIYQRGSFSSEDAAMTSLALLFLVLGLTVNGISSVLGHATLALQKTKAAVAVTIASQVVAIALFLILVPLLDLAGLALTSSLVPISIAFLYFIYLNRFIPNLKQIFISPTFLKLIPLSAALALSIVWLLPLASRLTPAPLPSLLLQLIIPAAIGSLIFFGGAYLWHIPEMEQLALIAKNKLKKIRA